MRTLKKLSNFFQRKNKEQKIKKLSFVFERTEDADNSAGLFSYQEHNYSAFYKRKNYPDRKPPDPERDGNCNGTIIEVEFEANEKSNETFTSGQVIDHSIQPDSLKKDIHSAEEEIKGEEPDALSQTDRGQAITTGTEEKKSDQVSRFYMSEKKASICKFFETVWMSVISLTSYCTNLFILSSYFSL